MRKTLFLPLLRIIMHTYAASQNNNSHWRISNVNYTMKYCEQQIFSSPSSSLIVSTWYNLLYACLCQGHTNEFEWPAPYGVLT